MLAQDHVQTGFEKKNRNKMMVLLVLGLMDMLDMHDNLTLLISASKRECLDKVN